MKAIRQHYNKPTIEFDLKAPIDPAKGLGGISFTQTVKDFRSALINNSINKGVHDNFTYDLDKDYFSMTIAKRNKEIEIEVDLLTGKINSMMCKRGYLGKLKNGIGIGTTIKTALSIDPNISFNLDTNWFDKVPFDGLIIYAPDNLVDKCFDTATKGIELPDFEIDSIELLNLEFAKEYFNNGELDFLGDGNL